MNEFDIIAKYFAPLTMGHGALDNDAAVLEIPPGQELIVTTDTLNEGTHFLKSASAADIAHKALRVSLSDLAAMGAHPLSYQLSLALPDRPSAQWLTDFTDALMRVQEAFNIFCSGGDTTGIKGPLSISITAMGCVPTGGALTRSDAQEGDAIIMTGPVGDAYIGLHLLSFLSPDLTFFPAAAVNDFGEGAESYFIERYYKPQPRLDLIDLMRTYAHAAIDISDGLLADLSHICQASNLKAEIHMHDTLFSPQAQKMITGGLVPAQELLSGGDDYQLLCAVAPENAEAFLAAAPGAVQIGHFTGALTEGEPPVTLLDKDDQSLPIKHTGWSHF